MVRYSLLMMQDNTICEGGSTPVFLFLTKMSFSLSYYLGFLFFFYRRRSRLFCIVVCVCNRHCVVLIPVRTLGRTACASSSCFFFLSISLAYFFAQKKKKKKKIRRSSATYNELTTTRK